MYFEVFAVHDRAAVGRLIMLGLMAEKVVVQGFLFLRIKALESHFSGPEVSLEKIHNLLGSVGKVKFHCPSGHLKLSAVREALRDY